MTSPRDFLFATCQIGAEPALKAEVAGQWPKFRFAFSRPGFVTFKLPSDAVLADDFDLHCVFARSYGFCLGKVTGRLAETMAREVIAMAGERSFQHVHVWQRDLAMPGEDGFEPGTTPLADDIGQMIAASLGAAQGKPPRINRAARARDLILDCVLVEPSEWWIGFHQAATMPTRWTGGAPHVDLPEYVVSRAYLKMNEALRWSRLPVRAGERCVEIGSAPGGASQALLERGLLVTGIDPAEMDAAVLAHPNFTHVAKRGRDVRRREFRGVRWLVADSNVAPKYTLDTVEGIVTHDEVHVRGMLLTLKLLDWKLAEQIPAFLERIRSWGYHHVIARQLAFNRQEICVAALRRRMLRRPPRKRTST